MNYLIYLFFAVLPSIIWLFIFLRKDKNPESKRAVLFVFILGGGAALLAGYLQSKLTELFGFSVRKEMLLFYFFFYHFIIISFIEEILKFFVVRTTVINNAEFDEPIDAMIYMITAALGFAAVENFVYFIRYEGLFGQTVYHYAFYFGFLRFLGATILHALSSAVLGFFMALSFLKIKRRMLFTFTGIFLATVLHTVYNLFIISKLERSFLFSSAFLVLFAIFIIYYAFSKLKKIKSICEL